MTQSLLGLVLALTTVSLLWSSEEAYAGAGLPWVILWCLAGLLCSLQKLNSARGDGREFAGISDPTLAAATDAGRSAGPRLLDIGWLLTGAGQWLSTARLFSVGGDRRTALNLSLEWLGLVIAWWLFRCAFRTAAGRRSMGTLLMAVISAIAVYGIWQHHVIYPEQSAWYRSERAALDALLSGNHVPSLVEVAEKSAEMQSQGIPLSGTDRILWEQRLLNSTEPTGTFALANTLAGILGVAVVLLLGSLMRGAQLTSEPSHSSKEQPARRWKQLLILLMLTVLTYCLVLTKSRTAWVGTAAGVGVLLAYQFRLSGRSAGGIRRVVLGICFVMAMFGTALITGAMDKEVLLESPRSLQFRALYWMGTFSALKEQPVFGFGPGNFRQHYLSHKRAESSEEIRDPHNLPLEAWSSGGLLSLLGIICCLSGLWTSRTSTTLIDPVPQAASLTSQQSSGRRYLRQSRWLPWKACLAGFLLYGGWQWLSGVEVLQAGDPLLLIPAVALFLCIAMAIVGGPISLTPQACMAGAVLLGIHLLGAGGFQMPGVMVVMAILLCGTVESELDGPGSPLSPVTSPADDASVAAPNAGKAFQETSGSQRNQRLARVLMSLTSITFCAAGLTVTVLWGLFPAQAVDQHLSLASHQQRSGNLRAAVTSLQRACAADPLAVVPRQRLAELESYRFRELVRVSMARRSERDQPTESDVLAAFDSAMAACRQLMNADPLGIVALRLQAANQWAMFQRSGDDALLKRAIADQQQLVSRYPTNVEDLTTLSQMAADCPEAAWQDLAVQAAVLALQQESINRSWGHLDRYLSELQLEELNARVAAAGANPMK